MGVCGSTSNLNKIQATPRRKSQLNQPTEEVIRNLEKSKNGQEKESKMVSMGIQTDAVMVLPLPDSKVEIYKKSESGSKINNQDLEIEGIHEENGKIVGLVVKETSRLRKKNSIFRTVIGQSINNGGNIMLRKGSKISSKRITKRSNTITSIDDLAEPNQDKVSNLVTKEYDLERSRSGVSRGSNRQS